MNKDYNIAILSIIKMIVANNGGCISRKLKQYGYESKNFIPAPELESALFQLQAINPKLFFQVMKNCDWNFGNNNWTNEPKYRDQIITAVQTHTGVQVDKNNWWNTTISYLQKQAGV